MVIRWWRRIRRFWLNHNMTNSSPPLGGRATDQPLRRRRRRLWAQLVDRQKYEGTSQGNHKACDIVFKWLRRCLINPYSKVKVFIYMCSLQAALLGVDILMNPERIPPLTKDYYWNKQDCPIPYTQVTWDRTIFWANKMGPINPLCLFRQPSIARSRLTGDLLLTSKGKTI